VFKGGIVLKISGISYVSRKRHWLRNTIIVLLVIAVVLLALTMLIDGFPEDYLNMIAESFEELF